MIESDLLDTFYAYLKRRRHFHESMLVVVENSKNQAEAERQQLLLNQLDDIIHHFEELVKDGLENS